ncbi:MAG: recombinase family protein [Oscillospiraceae bacterium]|nr:recombinase family protein [Oscillospiraceae bacterium]
MIDLRIAAYCRVSTDTDDQINSIEMQKRFFSEFAERNNYDLVNIYADEGISGTKIKNRVEFQRLMKDAKAGLFDLVAVKDISRFARNTVDFLQSIRALKSLGIETTFLTANMNVLGNSEFVLTIFGALAQEESANTSKRIKFSKKMNAEKGRVPNQVYGYDKIIGDYFNLYINDEESRWVKQVFDWYTEDGHGALKISHMLNSMGVKTKRGNKWSQVAINRMLRNELYTGKIINGKEEVVDFLTGERTEKAPDEWFVTDRPDLAIITEDQFDTTSKILTSRHGAFNMTKERHSNKYPLSTLIKCKECGCSFRRFERTYVNTYVKWICSGRNRHGTGSCENSTKVDESEILAEIDRYLAEVINNKDRIIKLAADKYAKYIAGGSSDDESVATIKESLKNKERRRQKYLDMYADDLITRAEMNEKVGEIRRDIELLKSELNKITGDASRTATPKDIAEAFEEIEKISAAEEKTNAQLKTILKAIEVNKDGNVEFILNTIGGL